MTHTIPATRRTEPLIPVGHPEFIWTTGADVQATWRKYGWTPPSEAKQSDEKKSCDTSQL